MGVSPFFFGVNNNMLNKRADKLELLRIAEAVALEKSIDKELIINSMETGIAKAAKSKFGYDNDIEKNKFVINKINENFDLSPRGIREMLGLNKPIYEKTAAYGHFGRTPESNGAFSWEKTDKTDIFSK